MIKQHHRVIQGLLPFITLLISIVSIQSGSALAKHMFPIIGAESVTILRLSIASLIMLVLLRPWRARFTLRFLGLVGVYGVALGSMNLLFYMSLRTLPLGIAVALEFSGPLLLAIFRSNRLLDFIWVLLALTGIIILIPIVEIERGVDSEGILYALAAGFFWMLYIEFGKKAGTSNGLQTAALGVFIATITIMPIGIKYIDTSLLNITIIGSAVGVAILSTALPYTLEMFALNRMSSQTFGTLMSLEPVCATLSGSIFLQEALSIKQWIAVILIICASIGTSLKKDMG